ncbi:MULTISPECIES: pitrilysin family protein [unclassified Aureispira]|uniref:M16 family metallopeptidase n=1 Tax=unclassified Aureispira TaxID=2649989 RepID=UPI000695BB96|nr:MULTISPECIES: M16 family metallopeptidase [unclassified Aureispira]WMX14923.1 insulinase family protein [Aureispira sp. CCB-E]
MNNASKFLALFLFILLGYAEMGCKSSSDTTSSNKNKEKETVAKSDTNAPSPVSGLGSLGSTATTDAAKEGASGMDAKLPFSPEVRTGKLDNGMQYYIRKNATPENRIELRLAVDAGSMQEDDDQQGLAHFVEHMAFNGTTNFEKNDLINFLEKTGVRFGADLNAYTSFDETVYMLQLPTDKEGLVDKGLLVMSDWATGITFATEEIDKERGVIQSEWRTGLGASERMRQVWWPKVFYNTRYADRLPIGLMDIIQNAPHDRFRRFYRDWYRPNLQAIIVVGDLDVDEMEKKIKEKFSGLKNPENPREKKLYEVPNHKETFVAIATDKEATGISLQLYTKHDAQKINTLDDYRTSLMHQLYNSMMSSRFDEIAQQNDAPFISAGAGYGNFVRSKDAYYASAQPKEDGILGSLNILLRENQRVLQHGFTDSELERQKLALEKLAERQYKERDKSRSANLAMECVYHFLNDAPLFGAEKEMKLVKEFLPTIKLEEINQLAKDWIKEENRAIVLTAPDKESVVLPTEEEIRKVLETAKDLKPEPYKDKFLDMPLMAKTPTAGKVVDTKKITKDDLEITEYTLSNGVRVILKPTDFKNDQILLTAYSPGGHSLYDDKDFVTAQNAANIVDEAGLGEFDLIALEKKLTGATVQIGPYIGELYEGFSGSSSVEDFETMLKLVHLYGTNPRKDKESFTRVMDQTKEQLRNLSANPMLYFQTEIQKIKTGNHPRRKVVPAEEDIDKIDFERVYEIYNDRFSDFSDFTFVLVGNFEPETIKPQLELYLGSLPSTNRKEKGKDVGVKYPTNTSTSNLKKGLAPQANVYMGFVQEEDWSQEKAYHVSSMAKVLSIMVRENLREDKGGVYSPYVGGGMNQEPKGVSDVTVFFQCAPEDVETLVEAVKEEIKSLQENGPSDENFNKIRETQRRSRESDLEKNRFWLNTLTNYYRTDRDLAQIKGYDQLVENLTKEDIQKAAKQFLDLEKSIIVTVKPEKEEVKGP